MAESDPPTPEPAPQASKPQASRAQAEFQSFKDRSQALGATSGGPAASFASPLPSAAIPAWSLRPASPAGYGPPGAGPGPYGSPAPSGGGGYASIVEGVGTTIRLGVEVLNAALSSSLTVLNGMGYAVGYGGGECDCDECNPCGGYDCCSIMGSGCGCCEPSVGSCC